MLLFSSLHSSLLYNSLPVSPFHPLLLRPLLPSHHLSSASHLLFFAFFYLFSSLSYLPFSLPSPFSFYPLPYHPFSPSLLPFLFFSSALIFPPIRLPPVASNPAHSLSFPFLFFLSSLRSCLPTSYFSPLLPSPFFYFSPSSTTCPLPSLAFDFPPPSLLSSSVPHVFVFLLPLLAL